jgi:ketosteroid isomerase-like protein
MRQPHAAHRTVSGRGATVSPPSRRVATEATNVCHRDTRFQVGVAQVLSRFDGECPMGEGRAGQPGSRRFPPRYPARSEPSPLGRSRSLDGGTDQRARDRLFRYVGPVDEPQELDAIIEESHRAIDAFARGDPAPLQALFSQREDVTLANPFGPAQRGWPQVRDTMARAAANYREGRAIGFDRLATHLAPGFACIHELERFEAKVGGSEDTTPVALRCTSVFRVEDSRWRIVHRHADPISVPRSAESVIQS